MRANSPTIKRSTPYFTHTPRAPTVCQREAQGAEQITMNLRPPGEESHGPLYLLSSIPRRKRQVYHSQESAPITVLLLDVMGVTSKLIMGQYLPALSACWLFPAHRPGIACLRVLLYTNGLTAVAGAYIYIISYIWDLHPASIGVQHVGRRKAGHTEERRDWTLGLFSVFCSYTWRQGEKPHMSLVLVQGYQCKGA